MIDNYLKELKLNGKSDNTRIYYESILKEAERHKPLDSWNKDDVTDFILSLHEKYKKGTIEAKKAVIKTYFKWAGKPEIVQHLKVKFPKTSLRRDDVLTIEDINTLIENASGMYQALIAALFESGGRINEVLPVRVGIDVKEKDGELFIDLHQTKTGHEIRTILCIFSAGYIRNYIDRAGLIEGDLLFPVKRPAVHVMLKKIAKKAGITKPVHPHSMRHAQAVDMLKRGYADLITKKKLGWQDDSRMLGRYSHCINEDVIDATRKMAEKDIAYLEGKQIIQKSIPNIDLADRIKVTGVALQISKLNEENKELKDRMAKRDSDFDELKRKMELITAAMAIQKYK